MKALLESAGYRQDASSLVWSAPGYGGIAYSDGDEVENGLAQAIREAEDVSVLSPELRRKIHDWPTLYHLSSARGNLLRPFQASLAGADVLEIGAGCGAITRFLGESGAHVLALEGSLRRADIARSRTRGLANVEVLAETFENFHLDHRFDVVTLIGVLEYANLYVSDPEPFLAMLQRARGMLKPDGRLLLAIENKVGLKYFAGAKEDHVGVAGYGIEDHYHDNGPRTFGHVELLELLAQAGFTESSLFSPFPDYKLPVTIVRQEGWDCSAFDVGTLAAQSARRDPQLPELLAFAPELAWPPLCANSLGQGLSNSHLVVASPSAAPQASTVLAYHYSTGRVPQFCKETRFELGADGRIEVVVDRLSQTQGSGTLIAYEPQLRSAYMGGVALSAEFARIVSRDGWTLRDLGACLDRYLRTVLELCGEPSGAIPRLDHVLPGSAFDLLPQNIHLISGGKPVAIDQEWTLEKPFTIGWLVFRTLSALMASITRLGSSSSLPASKADFFLQAYAAAGLTVSREQLDRYADEEAEVQAEVTGLSADALRDWSPQATLPSRNLLQEIGALRDEITQLQQALRGKEDELRRGREELTTLFASRSWRITKPLRLMTLFARGDFSEASRRINWYVGNALRRSLPPGIKTRLSRARTRIVAATRLSEDTSGDLAALAKMVDRRQRHAADAGAPDPLTAPWPAEWPAVDISVVTYNSRKWIDSFLASLEGLDYPRDRLHVCFVDNGSSDGTFEQLGLAVARLEQSGIRASALSQANLGFGAGHNAGLAGGTAPYGLVTNVDLVFEPSALKQIVAVAVSDPSGAAWELRQKPYEHPKYYDPVTGETQWNSHACVLLRRSAFEDAGGYDKNIFMYGEDVELSYRLRRAGWLLRYCPKAVVFHYSYESAGQVKPIQFTGSTFANLYLRLKYGSWRQALLAPVMGVALLARPQPFPGARLATAKNLLKLLALAPAALAARRKSDAVFPFRLWDYEMRRDGAFHEGQPLPADAPLVSVITRSFAGRAAFLREAMLSVAHQTYPNVELVVVEDGGETLRSTVEALAARTGLRTRFVPVPKGGRSAAGNAGLDAAQGRWCLFLDDDDLLFADHVETLALTLQANGSAVAAYSLAWEVETRYGATPDEPYSEVAYTVPPVLRQSFDPQILASRNYIAIQSILFERRLFEERGGLDADMDALEDWILWNVYAHGNQFAYVAKTTSLFRTPADLQARHRRNEIFARTYQPARDRFNWRIGLLADGFQTRSR